MLLRLSGCTLERCVSASAAIQKNTAAEDFLLPFPLVEINFNPSYESIVIHNRVVEAEPYVEPGGGQNTLGYFGKVK